MFSDKLSVVISPREGSDFSMDLIWAGLVRRFGQVMVADYPVRIKHRTMPILRGDPERDYGAERMSLCYVSGCETHPILSRADLVSMERKAQIGLVFMDETLESNARYLELFGMFPNVHHKIVVVAGHDRFRGDPLEVKVRYRERLLAMFIDDWQPEYDSIPGTYLMNLSCNFDHLWEVDRRDEFLADKQHDICFIGYNSHWVRKVVIDHIRERWGHLNNHLILEERSDTFSSFVRHKELFETMARSRICLNLPGASTCGRALRFYETPYVGSLMLSSTFPAKLLEPFEDCVHCRYFTSLDQLDDTIDSILQTQDLHDQIARRGHQFALSRHSVDARIGYMMGLLGPI